MTQITSETIECNGHHRNTQDFKRRKILPKNNNNNNNTNTHTHQQIEQPRRNG